jgi:adenylate cyclase
MADPRGDDPQPRDFEREGLLDGLEGDDRDARLGLLSQLAAGGVGMDELKRAVAEDRLALLPAELVFRRGCKYTLREALERAGLEEDFLRRDFLALGLSLPAPDEPAFDDADIESMSGLKRMLDAGVPEDQVHEMARVVGRGSAQTAETVLSVFVRLFLEAGDTEGDVGLRFAQVAEGLMPIAAPLMAFPLRLHMRELVRRQVIGEVERGSGKLPDARDVGVCFADLVAFTSLGEQASTETLGEVVERLGRHASEVAEPPVRLIKLIGDAAMLVSHEVPALVDAAAELLERVERDERLPALRAGIAAGPAFNRGGDWYGRTVNLASRLAGVAPPGTIVASGEVPKAANDGRRWERQADATLKGIDDPVPVYLLVSGGPAA